MEYLFEHHYYNHPANNTGCNKFENTVILGDYYNLLSKIRIREEKDLDHALDVFKYLDSNEAELLEISLKEILLPMLKNYDSKNKLNFSDIWNLDSSTVNKVTSLIIESAKKHANRVHDFSDDPMFIKLNKLKDLFSLNDIEAMFLYKNFLFKTHEFYADFIYRFSDGSQMTTTGYFGRDKKLSIEFKSLLLGCSIQDIRDIMGKNSPLTKIGLLDQSQNITNSIIDYFLYSNDEPFSSIHYYKDNNCELELEDFNHLKKDIDILKSLLTRRENMTGFKLLLYGKSGTGKSSFAKALLKNLSFETYVLKRPDYESDMDERKNDVTGLYCFEREPELFNKVLIIDEAEELLSTRFNPFHRKSGDMKKPINLFLEDSKSSQIWIVNSINDIDDSTKRRFNYSINFQELSDSARKNIWEKQLQIYNYKEKIPVNIIEDLSKKYPVGPGIINKCIDNFYRVSGEEALSDNLISVSDNTIMSYLKLNNLESIVNQDYKDNSLYSSSAISIKEDLNDIIDTIQTFNSLRNNSDINIKNLNIIFHGAPGTGKTEFARYLSFKVDRRILSKSGKDLLGQYVGETEKNIANAFLEAERENMILHIDEIDSIIFNRKLANRNWEVSQINEFLQSMENFKGILICTTNRLDQIDDAALRRFSLKVEFDYLKPEGIKAFFEIYFKEIKLTSVQESLLISIKNLTPGDFKVVYNMYMLRRNKPCADRIIEMLQAEVGVKNMSKENRIGFV
ncbi:MAG: ATP-binding protein [Spirochaetales bacterium]|nr:ATP-binding protein [Spirochaetales bacterium]